jgi:hypothetical protein
MTASKVCQDFRRPIGGMVVRDNHVEGEIGPLREGAFHRIGDGSGAVPHGNDDARLDGKGAIRNRDVPERRGKTSPDPSEMRRRLLLHLLLEQSILRIDVGEVVLAGLSGSTRACRSGFRHDGKALRKVENPAVGRDLQPKAVPARPSGWREVSVFPERPAGGGGRDQDQGAEIEAVADASRLVIVQGMFAEDFAAEFGVVRIDHPRPGRRGRGEQTVRGAGIDPDVRSEEI